MIIAIDYDGTFTADPVLWSAFLATARSRDYRLICASSRKDTAGNRAELQAGIGRYVEALILCGGQYKAEVCRSYGYDVDVWIDNDPRTDRKPRPLWWCRLVGALQSLFPKPSASPRLCVT